jgi:uncharacterized membrane protein YgcG
MGGPDLDRYAARDWYDADRDHSAVGAGTHADAGGGAELRLPDYPWGAESYSNPQVGAGWDTSTSTDSYGSGSSGHDSTGGSDPTGGFGGGGGDFGGGGASGEW